MAVADSLMLVGEIFVIIGTIIIQILIATFRVFVPPEKKSVQGEVVLVTGAGSGIGRLLSLKFAALGAKVICSDINEKSNNDTVESIKSNGGQAYGITFDCSNYQEVTAAAEKIRSDVGNVTILINNAGIASGELIEDIPVSEIEKTMKVNTFSIFWTTKAFLPHMKQRNHGHVVNVASSAGLGGVARLSAYCASKFGAVGISESLTCELESEGIDNVFVTVIAPYFIGTGMFDGIKTRFPLLFPVITPEDAAQRMVDGIRRNERTILLPTILRSLLVLKWLLPIQSVLTLSRFLGFTDTMKTYTGREEKKTT